VLITVNGEHVNYSTLPMHQEAFRQWVEHGRLPGDTLQMILRHDLWAVLRCDQHTLAALPDILRWLHNHAPSNCHGSDSAIAEWCHLHANERNTHIAEPLRSVVNVFSGGTHEQD
jgi:hypothetical protein